MTPRPPGLFVVGTDTGVGKTAVAAALARTWMQAGRRVGVLKPAATGASLVAGRLVSADVAALIAAITTEGSPFPPPAPGRVGPLVYEAPLAPPLAARRAGGSLAASTVIAAVEASLRWWADEAGAELMVVEGVGGLLCPLADGGWTVADLAICLDYPILIVAHRGLGTLNHALMTVEIARTRGLRVAGIVLNGARAPLDPLAESSNAEALAALLPTIPILADWPHDPAADHVPVAPAAANWFDLAQPPRPPGGRARGDGLGPFVAPTLVPSLLIDSDDELLPDPVGAGLIGTTTTSASPAPDGPPPPRPRSGSFAPDLAALDFGPRPAGRPAPKPATGGGRDDDWPVEGAPTSWTGVLLASYSSAITLAFAWTWWHSRVERAAAPVAPPVIVADEYPSGGRLAERSRRVETPRPIPPDRLLPLGQRRRFDALEVEPIGLARQDLALERVNLAGKVERRPGDKRALVLRVRLVNRSSDQVFAPVDPVFVRGRSGDIPETLLDLDDGRRVYPGPLAVDSEWAVVGESFADLRPGESREVVFATAGNAPPDADRLPATWRLKLRTGVDSIAEIGVRLPGKP